MFCCADAWETCIVAAFNAIVSRKKRLTISLKKICVLNRSSVLLFLYNFLLIQSLWITFFFVKSVNNTQYLVHELGTLISALLTVDRINVVCIEQE